MMGEPQKEHEWLHQLVGAWTAEMTCSMGPGQPPTTSTGAETVRSLGGLWTLGEGEGTCPDGTPVTSLMTLGFDPARGRFVGTFVASMMTMIWRYYGALSADDKSLVLDTEGPSMAGDGSTAKYQDIITFLSPDHRTLTSRALGADGQWTEFMATHYRRIA
ncbi:DUF1579 domain-containing protein [Bosea sp. TAF32]|uniref:DUF1579 domain-containing protein n=1 Tax=Bosea sp. TAF32 TaxID=3237482 RepID=UPI003F929C8F